MREFEAGRYNPATRFPKFLVTSKSARPGAPHASNAEALEASDADGTRSILDMERIGGEPDYGVVVALPGEILKEFYRTEQSTHTMVEKDMPFLDDIERGQGIYFLVYDRGAPSEIFFAGFPYD